MLADKTGDLAKAGAKFSAAAREKLAKAHQAIREAGDHLASTGYDKDCDDEDGSKAEAAADLAKVAGERDLAKAEAVKIAAERDALQKRCKELEALPAPARRFSARWQRAKMPARKMSQPARLPLLSTIEATSTRPRPSSR